MKLDRPLSFYPSLLRDLSIAIAILLSVGAIAIALGSHFKPQDLGNWGSWVGAFIAGIALVASSYAVIQQSRHGESTSWNIALNRLGEIYDVAQNNERLARIITEPVDFSANSLRLDPDDLTLTPQERIWFGSLFLAFEQIFVATNSLSPESRRVWRVYLRNQFNKPTIRAAFVRDCSGIPNDYHNEFWTFVRGKPSKHEPGYRDFVIHPRFFDMQDNRKSSGEASGKKILVAKLVERADMSFWMSLYGDPEVKQQMYAVPMESESALWDCLAKRTKVYTVWDHDQRVGGFSLGEVSPFIATFGIALHADWRGKGFGHPLVHLLEAEAIKSGYKTLRADVYADNLNSIRLLERDGFRKFIWLEKNL
jgi:RimJ/RimL family protein N-acetyltransferase